MKNGRWIKADGTEETVVPKNGKFFGLEELQKFVGGYIEIVKLSEKRFMVFNEEGKLDQLPLNKEATRMFLYDYSDTGDYVVGNVLVCHQNLIP